MESVHVLAGIDPAQGALGVQTGGEGQLDQDPIHLWIAVEPVDQGIQFSLAGSGGNAVLQGADAGPGAGGDLAAHIHLAGRICTHQDHRQAGRAQAQGRAARHPLLDLGQHPVGVCFPIQNQDHRLTPLSRNFHGACFMDPWECRVFPLVSLVK